MILPVRSRACALTSLLPCAQHTGRCAELSGTLSQQGTGQCICSSTKTVYPVGVDNMTVMFDHTYEFPNGKFGLDEYRGTSTVPEREVDSRRPLVTSFLESSVASGDSGEQRIFRAGEPISLTLGEWLATTGTSLERANDLASTDLDGREGAISGEPRLPVYRMTGMVVTVLISYSNGPPTLEAQPTVFANITSEKQLLPWAGPGSERVHIVYPSGPVGAQTFEYVDRYGQGVVFDFHASGKVYKFDFSFFLNTLITGIVLLGVAGTITNFIAFNLLPGGHSQMLAAARFEPVSRRRGFAELGMSNP
jgi:hypothetical protein